jgi:lipooligosaccharide transport system permease protein
MGLTFAVRELRFWLTDHRRTWRGSTFTIVASPVLYLAAMGLGLGALVDAHGTARLGGVSYLTFLAPGIMAALSMQVATADSTYPVHACVQFLKIYQAAIASPLRPSDLFHGHLLFTTLRLTMTSSVCLVVMTAFGAVRSAWAVAAVPAAVLTGLAFAAPIEAYAIRCTKESPFALLSRFVIVPMFLFSGTFFPVSALPTVIRRLAYVTPLYNGVALCRSLSLGSAQLGASALHVGYLVAVAAIGVAVGNRTYRRRLYA